MGCYHSSLADARDSVSDDFRPAKGKLGDEQGPSFTLTPGTSADALAQLRKGMSSASSNGVLDAYLCPSVSDQESIPGSSSRLDSATASQRNSKLRTDCKVRDVYNLSKTLGTGGFSVVKMAVEKSNGREWACKILDMPAPESKQERDKHTWANVFKEIDIMCQMHHENVVHINEYFVEGSQVYIITELLMGGDLLDTLHSVDRFREQEARLCFEQLLRGLEYMHSRNIMHRDIKLENLLLVRKHDVACVKIADFGLAKEKMMDDKQSVCGTPQFVAPEVINGMRYTSAVDMWSAGVVLFTLLSGFLPFYSESRAVLFDQIRRGDFSLNEPEWHVVSNSAKDLIHKLLVVDPAKRLTASQALQHEWISQGSAKVTRTLDDFTPMDDPMDGAMWTEDCH